jgi:hypothetical protein
MRTIRLLAGALALASATVVAGCGAQPERKTDGARPYSSITSGSTTQPTPSESPHVTRKPTKPTESAQRPTPTPSVPPGPPRDPTDNIKKTDIVVGTVTRGGRGPCYGLQTDDGTEYALYSNRGHQWTAGTRVRVRVKPSAQLISCGTGRFVEITEFLP